MIFHISIVSFPNFSFPIVKICWSILVIFFGVAAKPNVNTGIFPSFLRFDHQILFWKLCHCIANSKSVFFVYTGIRAFSWPDFWRPRPNDNWKNIKNTNKMNPIQNDNNDCNFHRVIEKMAMSTMEGESKRNKLQTFFRNFHIV